MTLRYTGKPKRFGLPYICEFLHQNTYVLLSFLLLSVILSACGQFSQSQSSNKTETNVSFPNAPEKQNTLIIPPDVNAGSSTAGQKSTQMMPNGLPALQGLKGVKVDQLFSQNIRDTDQRFDRLEQSVINLIKEFEAVKPAVIRLVAVESDMQQLVDLLEVTLRDEPPAAPIALVNKAGQAGLGQSAPDVVREPAFVAPPSQVAAAQSPPTSAAQPQVAPQANHMKGAFVKQLRIGRHDSFTRIVMDVNQSTPHNVELDSQENIILIELPEAGWNTQTSKTLSKLPSVKSYLVQPMNNGKGSRIVVTLKNSVKILRDKVIPPNQNVNFRIYIDINAM